jgi:ABC 3 transport family
MDLIGVQRRHRRDAATGPLNSPALAAMGIVAVDAIAVPCRPLLPSSALPDVAEARGASTRPMDLCFLLVMAPAASMTVPVAGAPLMSALMIGPAAATRSFTGRPGRAMTPAAGIALVTVRAGITASCRTNWPPGIYAGVIAAGFRTRRRPDHRCAGARPRPRRRSSQVLSPHEERAVASPVCPASPDERRRAAATARSVEWSGF